jgi:hypothetical protein
VGERVSVTVEGREIDGEVVHRSVRGVQVRIEEPYILTRSVSRPIFLMGIIERYRPSLDLMAEYGDRTIDQFLIDLDTLARFIEQNRDALVRKDIFFS